MIQIKFKNPVEKNHLRKEKRSGSNVNKDEDVSANGSAMTKKDRRDRYAPWRTD